MVYSWCVLYPHVELMLIIDDDLIISLSSLKKNRKATFDVLFWGVLNSAFFVSLYVSMMESHDRMGVPNLNPPQK